MKRKTLIVATTIIALILAIALFLVFYVFSGPNGGKSASPLIDATDQRLVMRGKDIYAKNCAACHGANLEGQPNWQERFPNGRLPAPPHDETGHTWHHPDAQLIDLVKNGLVAGRTAPDGYESDMPAFGQSMSDADIIAVLAYIKSTWPREIIEAQEEVTLQQQRR